jgi:hypothetical protein
MTLQWIDGGAGRLDLMDGETHIATALIRVDITRHLEADDLMHLDGLAVPPIWASGRTVHFESLPWRGKTVTRVTPETREGG